MVPGTPTTTGSRMGWGAGEDMRQYPPIGTAVTAVNAQSSAGRDPRVCAPHYNETSTTPTRGSHPMKVQSMREYVPPHGSRRNPGVSTSRSTGTDELGANRFAAPQRTHGPGAESSIGIKTASNQASRLAAPGCGGQKASRKLAPRRIALSPRPAPRTHRQDDSSKPSARQAHDKPPIASRVCSSPMDRDKQNKLLGNDARI